MNPENRAEAIFGVWDGVVSIIGFVFALLIHHASRSTIAVGGFGGAISATVSMATGEFEKADDALRRRLGRATAMGIATIIGSLVPVLPFFVFGIHAALVAGGIASLLLAGWVGYEKRRGAAGYVQVYITLLLACGLTLAIVSAIPGGAS